MKLSRHELVSIIAFVAIVAIAIMVFNEKPGSESTPPPSPNESNAPQPDSIEKASLAYEQMIRPYLVRVPIGTFASLDNTKELIDPLTSDEDLLYYPWDGTMRARIDSAMVFESFEDAKTNLDLGSIAMSEVEARRLYGQGTELLILTITVVNDTAESIFADYTGNPNQFSINPIFTPYYPDLSAVDKPLGTVPWTSYWSCPLATFNTNLSHNEEGSLETFELAPGDSGTLITGYWIPSAENGIQPECTDYSKIVLRPLLNVVTPSNIIFELNIDGKSEALQ